jgi:threonine dehydratase
LTVLALGIEQVHDARVRIAPHAVRTPLLRNSALDAAAGGQVFIKAENLQTTGSFKFRGAMNRLLALSTEEIGRGVVAFSSGNHALAVAEAARFLGCTAVIIMPLDAPTVKVAGVRARGAEVIQYDRDRDDREAIAADLISARGLSLVHPFDDPFVIAGQGTAALEAVEQLKDDFNVDRVDQALICCSGGGLAAGWGMVIKYAFGEADIVTVEPDGFDDTARSLASGDWKSNERTAGTICDALQVSTPGKITLPLLLSQGAKGVTVTDEEVLAAMNFAASHLKLVLEPGGAAPLAAVLSGKVKTTRRTTLLIASGGNVDPAMLISSIDRGAT